MREMREYGRDVEYKRDARIWERCENMRDVRIWERCENMGEMENMRDGEYANLF
tara:strand:- start:647 stop:808 length:162 start_codon:yes stop_codon:yes gene_type:complete